VEGSAEFIIRRAGWEANSGGEPCHSITNSDGSGVLDPNVVAGEGIQSRANVPTFKVMRGPGASVFRFDMGEDATTRWAEGSAIEIKRPIELGIGGQLGVDLRTAEEV